MPPRKKQKTAHNTSGDRTGADHNPILAAASKGTVAKRINTSRRPRSRGCLEGLLEAPIEVVLEIFGQVHPRDLCNLVRTCKLFRDFFLHPTTSEKVWKASIKNHEDDLPEQPPFLSEPAFVHLLYSPYCHNCGVRIVHKPIWTWFTRCCSNCLLDVSMPYADAIRMVYEVRGTDMYAPLDRMFCIYVTKPGIRFCPKTEKYFKVLNTQVDAYIRALQKVKRLRIKNQPDKFEKLVAKWKDDATLRREYAAGLKEWFKEQEEMKIRTLDARREQRFSDVISRLEESEWSEELKFMGPERVQSIALFPVVRRSTKLTNGEWLKVQAELKGYLQTVRNARLRQRRIDIIQKRLSMLDEVITEYYAVQIPRSAQMDPRPEYIQFAFVDECRALADAPDSHIVTRDDFAAIVPAVAARLEVQMKEELIEHLTKRASTFSATKDPLGLAVAIFVCEDCGPTAYMRYPEVLSHPCFYDHDLSSSSDSESTRSSDDGEDVYTDAATDLSRKLCEVEAQNRLLLSKVFEQHRGSPPLVSYSRGLRAPFSFENAVFGSVNNHDASRCMQEAMNKVVSALGFDPTHATAEELDKCDARLQCVDCVKEEREVKVFAWQAAIKHSVVTYDWEPKHGRWKRVSNKKMVVVRELEAAAHVLSLDLPGSVWACSLCPLLKIHHEFVRAHLKGCHNILNFDECVQDGTVYLHSSRSWGIMKPPVVLPLP